MSFCNVTTPPQFLTLSPVPVSAGLVESDQEQVRRVRLIPLWMETERGASSTEAIRLADRQEGPTQGEPSVQAKARPTLVETGRKRTEVSRQAKHADGRSQPEAPATGNGDPR
jgi:hypothetical protein